MALFNHNETLYLKALHMLAEKDKQTITESLAHIAKNLPGFQPRAAQRQMIAAVANTLACSKKSKDDIVQKGESILVIEGPTGTGKSLAYLLPAIVMAKSLAKKLVISSATIMLQEQLLNKDLQFIKKHAGLNITFSIAKGRGRYACTHRLAQHLNNDDTLFDEQRSIISLRAQSTFQQLADLLNKEDWSGDRDNLAENIPDDIWSQITNDRHGCIKNHCAYFSTCPFFIARKQIEEADVIIANHDLLLADILMGGGVVLPAPADSFYCIDEAHQLADKAVNQFAAYHSINASLNWLDKAGPTLNRLTLAMKSSNHAEKMQKLFGEISNDLIDLRRLLSQLPAQQMHHDNLSGKYVIRFTHGILPQAFFIISQNLLFRTQGLKTELTNAIENLKKIINSHATSDKRLLERTLTELSIGHGRISNMVEVWQLMTTENQVDIPPIAKWITTEIKQKGDNHDYSLFASPVRASDMLREHLWKKVAGAILTSATLRSLGSFNLILEATGLNHFPNVNCVALASPFNYQQQGQLVIPNMRSDPKDSVKHTQEIISLLPKIMNTAEGEGTGTLVLFASKKQMQDVAAGLASDIQQLLLIQGQLSKEKIIKEHFSRIDANQPSILFGLASFAEGLDLPANYCTHVIIAKLPFAVPDDPVTQTLAEWIEHNGGNAFFQISLPHASIKLTQAVGRLLRSETDTGTITILDTRLKTKPYGRLLLNNLPPFRQTI
jgi:ATP-dependent DNA helicase DinG